MAHVAIFLQTLSSLGHSPTDGRMHIFSSSRTFEAQRIKGRAYFAPCMWKAQCILARIVFQLKVFLVPGYSRDRGQCSTLVSAEVSLE